MMHPGKQLWIYKHALLSHKYEGEVQGFALALLTDVREAIGEG